jgi:Uma2 family endonuclease
MTPAVTIDIDEQELRAIKRWTRHELNLLSEAELIDLSRVELIDGQIIEKMSKHPLHSFYLTLFRNWCITHFGMTRVLSEVAVDLGLRLREQNEPEPDIVVLDRKSEISKFRNPEVPEIALAVEIAHSNPLLDLKVKERLYAEAGIVEYWVVRIKRREIVVHRLPTSQGYRSIETYRAGDHISPLFEPEAVLDLAAFFATGDSTGD